MEGVVIAAESLPSFEFQSIRYAGEVVHKVKVTGMINLERRLPLYHRTLAANQSHNFFCILDNSGGHENTLSLQDMVLLDRILIEGGIRNFYGAIITKDPNYEGIVKLASYSAETSGMEVELLATGDPSEAERFILEKLGSVAH